jgi:hypothetical protein
VESERLAREPSTTNQTVSMVNPLELPTITRHGVTLRPNWWSTRIQCR